MKDLECQHEFGKENTIWYREKKLVEAIESGVLRDETGIVEDEIIERAKRGRGHAWVDIQKCRKCEKEKIIRGMLVSGGMEYIIEADGIIGPAFSAP